MSEVIKRTTVYGTCRVGHSGTKRHIWVGTVREDGVKTSGWAWCQTGRIGTRSPWGVKMEPLNTNTVTCEGCRKSRAVEDLSSPPEIPAPTPVKKSWENHERYGYLVLRAMALKDSPLARRLEASFRNKAADAFPVRYYNDCC